MDIISRFILNKIFLKEEFYRHYYLSITINVIISAILSIYDINFIIKNNEIALWIYLVKSIILVIFYCFENVEGKLD